MEGILKQLETNDFTQENLESILVSLKKLDQSRFEKFLLRLDDLYHNTDAPIVPDWMYDIFRQTYEEKFGKYQHIGAKTDKIQVQLKHYLGGMEKIKEGETKELDKWLTKNKGPYTVEEKLDGVAGLLIYDAQGNKSLASRGSAFGRETKGYSMDTFLPYLKLPKAKNLAVRLEMIISKANFRILRKTHPKLANPRNTMSGLVTAKTLSKREDRVRRVTPVAFEVIEPKGMKAFDQLQYLKDLGFEIPRYTIVDHKPNDSELLEILVDFRERSKYEIDGIIIYDDSKVHQRDVEINTIGNPKYAIAYKSETETVDAEVVKVLWQDSRHRKVKPTVEIVPTQLGGITITHATGDNAKFIKDNRIGPGAIVTIARAGEVIPKIKTVVHKTEAQMPTVRHYWTKTGVDIILDEEVVSPEVATKIILFFFQSLQAKGVSKATFAKLVDQGFTTVTDVLGLSLEDLKQLFGPKQSENIYQALHSSVKNLDMATLMGATTEYFGEGMGIKKIQSILDTDPDIFSNRNTTGLVTKISQIKGWSEESAEQFVGGLEDFWLFLDENPEITIKKPVKKVVPTSSKLNGKKIVMTGMRDKSVENFGLSQGATFHTSVSKNTDIVIAADPESTSGKAAKARELGIEILSVDQFKKKYT